MAATARGVGPLLVSHWQISPGVCALAAAVCALYLAGAVRVRARGRAAKRAWPMRDTCSFLAGVAIALVATESGVGAYDDRLLSVHMVQHMLLLLIAPLLILGGHPVLLMLRSLPPGGRRGLLALLARARSLLPPAVCIGAFSLLLVAIHLPAFYDATLRHPALHLLEHALLVAMGLLLWWPLTDSDPISRVRMGGIARVIYLLASMPAMALVGAYLNRAPHVVYPPYSAPARELGVSAVIDQQQAGAIMWVGGSSFMIAAGLWLAMSWMMAEERRLLARERLQDARAQDGLAERALPVSDAGR